MDEYGQPKEKKSVQPKEKKSVWDTLGTGIDKFFTFRTAQEQRRATQEQQKIEELRLKQLEQQGLIEGEETKRSAISEQSATEQFLAKIKANKAVLVPLGIAGALAIAGVGYYYFKKAKKG